MASPASPVTASQWLMSPSGTALAMSPDEIVSEYPTLTLSDVHAALAYYYDHRDELDQDIREDEKFVEQLRAVAPSIFEELRAPKTDAAGDSIPS